MYVTRKNVSTFIGFCILLVFNFIKMFFIAKFFCVFISFKDWLISKYIFHDFNFLMFGSYHFRNFGFWYFGILVTLVARFSFWFFQSCPSCLVILCRQKWPKTKKRMNETIMSNGFYKWKQLSHSEDRKLL